jgi:hypothetical protein
VILLVMRIETPDAESSCGVVGGLRYESRNQK